MRTLSRMTSLDFLVGILGRRWHYAWVILLSSVVIVAISSGFRQSFGVILPPLLDIFGWSVGASSFAFFLMFISGVPLILAAGVLSDSLGVRPVVLVGALIMTLGTFLTATVGELWQFYLFFSVLIGGISVVFIGLLPAVLTQWFHRHMGLAVGVSFVAAGLGPVAFPPLLDWMFGSVGWRDTFLILGLATGVPTIIASLLLRSTPRDVGQRPYGEEAPLATDSPEPAPTPPAPRVTLRSVQRGRPFWSLTSVHLLGCLGHSVILAHVVRMAILRDISEALAAGLLSAIAATSLASRIVVPLLVERWGGRNVLTVGYVIQGIAVFLYLWAGSTAGLYVVSLLLGFGFGAEMSGFPVVNRQFYGANAPLNTIHSWEIAGGMIGMGLGGWLGGVLFDLSGSYDWSVWLGTIATFAAIPLILSLPRLRQAQLALGHVH